MHPNLKHYPNGRPHCPRSSGPHVDLSFVNSESWQYYTIHLQRFRRRLLETPLRVQLRHTIHVLSTRLNSHRSCKACLGLSKRPTPTSLHIRISTACLVSWS